MNEGLRQEALEKELLRLKAINQKQSKKLHRLRKVVFFLLLFFGVLLFMLSINGIIQLPEKRITETKTAIPANNTFSIDSLHKKTTSSIQIPDQFEDGLIFKIPDNGILYSVQIGAYASIEMTPYKLNLLSLQQYSYEGINQFSVGLFTDYLKAQNFLYVIKQMGFTDAFLISTKNGKRITVNDAIDIQKKTTSQPSSPDLQASGELLNQTVIREKFASDNP